MIWLTWRQFRTQAWVGAAVLALVAATLLATAPALFDAYRESGLEACTSACEDAARTFKNSYVTWLNGVLYLGGTAVLHLFPALLGAFWGAPLVARELESGTHRLVWSQSISRTRWLAVKLAGGALAVALLAGLVSLLVTWWTGPLDAAEAGRVTPVFFGARGVVPVGYALVGFAAGVLIGLLARRTVLAMGLTLLVVGLFQFAMPALVRPVLVEPVHSQAAFDRERLDMMGLRDDGRIDVRMQSPAPHAWVLSNRTIDTGGKEFHGPVQGPACSERSGPDSCIDHLATLGLRQDITYVPTTRFWALQWRELGVLLGLTALPSIFSMWWLRRRTT